MFSPQGGDEVCKKVLCPVPNCVDPVTAPDTCCDRCPNGQSKCSICLVQMVAFHSDLITRTVICVNRNIFVRHILHIICASRTFFYTLKHAALTWLLAVSILTVIYLLTDIYDQEWANNISFDWTFSNVNRAEVANRVPPQCNTAVVSTNI